jgi:hypothetical protein
MTETEALTWMREWQTANNLQLSLAASSELLKQLIQPTVSLDSNKVKRSIVDAQSLVRDLDNNIEALLAKVSLEL